MAQSAFAENGSPLEGMTELRSDPIFLSQFLKLALPPIDAVNASQGSTPNGDSYMPPSVGSPPELTTVPKIEPWINKKTGKPFVEDLTTMIANMDETENFQHILPPPAFRRGDLPQATMLPTVHLWCIIQAWQPFNRVLHLEEEISLGGHTKEGRLRGALQLSDHTPEHASKGKSAIPRQLIFRRSEGNEFRGVIIVKEPWIVSLPDLFDDKGSILTIEDTKTAKGNPTQSALLEVLSYLQCTKSTHAILTTYQHFVFIRCDQELTNVQISPVIAAGDRKTTVYSALWYFCRDIAPLK